MVAASTKKRKGRPPLKPEARRVIEIKVRLNAAEKRSLDEIRGDLSLAVWLRDLGLDQSAGA